MIFAASWPRIAPITALICCAALLAPFGAAPAGATGVARVQQRDGTVQVYDGVTIHIVRDKSLTVTSADGKGSLIINNAACSYIGDVMRCLLYGIALDQDGTTKPFEFDRGTLYLNFTSEGQHLPYSTHGIPSRGIVMSVLTKRGTYINVTGTIDSETGDATVSK